MVTPSGGSAAVDNLLVDTGGCASCGGGLSQAVVESDGSGNLVVYYVRIGGQLLAEMRPGCTPGTWSTKFVHGDGLGSVRALTDETGTTIDTRGYEAFGTKNARRGATRLCTASPASRSSRTPCSPTTGPGGWMRGWGGSWGWNKFPGFSHRPMSLHRYLYASNNPVLRRDPSGLDDLIDVQVAAMGEEILATGAEPVINGAAIVDQGEAALEIGELETAEVEAEIEAEAEAELEGAEAECSGGQCIGNLCFAPETLVATESGLRPIADIQVGISCGRKTRLPGCGASTRRCAASSRPMNASRM